MSTPIYFTTIASARDNQIPDYCLKSSFFSISSELGYCVKDETSGSPVLHVVFTNGQGEALTIPMKGDAAIMNPSKPAVVVLRTPQIIYAMDVYLKQPLGRYVFQQAVQIDFWCWIDSTRLAIVYSDGVYIWDYTYEQSYQPLFYRDVQLTGNLQNMKITSFALCGDWAVLYAVGIDPSTNTVYGNLYLHSFSKYVSKVLPAHASALLNYREDEQHTPCVLLAFAQKQPGAAQIDMNVMECGPVKDEAGNSMSGFNRQQFAIPINPAIAASEFPMYMRASKKFGFVFTVTKTGMIYIHDAPTGVLIHQTYVSQKGCFSVAWGYDAQAVFACGDSTVQTLQIDENTIVDFVLNRLGKQEAAYRLAIRANLRGADKLFTHQFEDAFQRKEYYYAAQIAKRAPADTIRNAQTIYKFVNAADQVAMGQKPPVFVYLGCLLENDGKLSCAAETMELARQLNMQGKLAGIEQLYEQGKLFDCEEFGDLLLQSGMDKLAFRVFNACKAHEKCILYLITQGKLEAIVKYAERFPEYKPDYPAIINKGLALGAGLSADGVEKLRNFSFSIISQLDMSQYEYIVGIADSFKAYGYIKEAAYLLLEVCKRDECGETSGPFYTRVIEMSLETDPAFAQYLLQKKKLLYFDKNVIYYKCEDAKLYNWAIYFAPDNAECLRIASTYGTQEGRAVIEPEEFAAYCLDCGRFDDVTYDVIDGLFEFFQNMLNVYIGDVRIYAMHVALAFSRLPIVATSPELTVTAVQVFESYELSGSEALFCFLATVFPSSIDPEIHKLYLKCAVIGNKEQDILRVCRDSNFIDGVIAFQVLTETSTKCETTVITGLLTICMRFNLSAQLAKFLCDINVKKPKNYLYFINNSVVIIEYYLTNFAPEECHNVLAALFDNGVMSSQEVNVLDGIFTVDMLSRILASSQVRDRCDINKVVEVCMRNSKTIRVVRQMLEYRLLAGATDAHTHTAFAKILIEVRDQGTEKFIIENPYFDHCDVCEYCVSSDRRRRDTFVYNVALKCAITGAFSSTNPLEISNAKAANLIVYIAFGCYMYRELASFMLKKGSYPLWEIALLQNIQPYNPEFFTMNSARTLYYHRENFVQAIAQNTSVPVEQLEDSAIVACITPLVKIQDSDSRISKCLMLLLERVILTPASRHTQNTSLHNLLIIAAVKARELSQVSKFVKMQDLVYDPDIIAKVCIQVAQENNMVEFYEYAFDVYRRFDRLPEAVDVLIQHMGLERAEQFAETVNQAPVFAVLGAAQLKISQYRMKDGQAVSACLLIRKASACLIKAKDCETYKVIIQVVFQFNRDFQSSYVEEANANFVYLIDYLRSARTQMFLNSLYQDHVEADTALMYAYVRLDKFDELEQFLAMTDAVGSGIVPNKGDILRIGDRAYSEKRYFAAKMLFNKVQAWAKLALALLKLQDFQNAVDAARRADEVPCWRTVNAACMLAGQLYCAKTAGMYLVVLPDELARVIRFYENNGFIADLLELLESGVEHPQAKAFTNKEQNIFTACAIALAHWMWYVEKQGSQRLMRFLRAHFERVSVALAISACKESQLWHEVVYMYVLSKEYDKAISEMLLHPASFDHKQMLQICGQASQIDLLTQVTEFYIQYFPKHLKEFLTVSKLGYFHKEDTYDDKRKDFLSVDAVQVLRLARQYNIIFLIAEFLELCVSDGQNETNNALIDFYIKSHQPAKLKAVLRKTTAFDQLAVLDTLSTTAVPQLKRVAVTLFASLKRYDEGIKFAIVNRFYDEAAECAQESGDEAKAEVLLRLICGKEFKDKEIRSEIFAVAVSRCNEICSPDVVLELAWRFNMTDFCMPFMVGALFSMKSKVKEIEEKRVKLEKDQQSAAEKSREEFTFEQAGGNATDADGWAPAENW